MITVTLNKPKQEEKPFPKLMITTSNASADNRIVLFFDNNKGVCLQVGDKTTAYVGEVSEWKLENFTDYNEPVTIQNT